MRVHGLNWRGAIAAGLLALGGCADAPTPRAEGAQAPSGALPSIRLPRAFSGMEFDRPVFITHDGTGSNRLYVVEQTGRILTFENRDDVKTADVFLNVKAKTRTRHNEEGLLSLAFHPNFANNREFFVYYTTNGPKRNVISRFRVKQDNRLEADLKSEEVILEVEQKHGNHNGSTLLFGPEGYLFASFGDGGSANDPDGNGQNLKTLLGKIIRIDVDRKADGKNYSIPVDNPFTGDTGVRPEIYAFGLRNVWRMSFDQHSGELWAGDVGQNAWEEIDLIKAGGNYGWNLREGAHTFSRGKSGGGTLIDPIVEYSHLKGLSVTGGYVYRGAKYESLKGVYVYADYASGRVWGLRYNYDQKALEANGEILHSDEKTYITSFGEDQDGELLVCAFDRMDGGKGRIYRVVAN